MKTEKWNSISIIISAIFGIVSIIILAITAPINLQNVFNNEKFDYDSLKPYATDIVKGTIDPMDLEGDGINAYIEIKGNYVNVYIEYEKYGLKASFPTSSQNIIEIEKDGTILISRNISFENVEYHNYKTSKNPIIVITFLILFGILVSITIYYLSFLVPIGIIKIKKINQKK